MFANLGPFPPNSFTRRGALVSLSTTYQMPRTSRKRSHPLTESSTAANQLPAPRSKVQKTTGNAQSKNAATTALKPSAEKSGRPKTKLTSKESSKPFYLTTIAAINKKVAPLDDEVENRSHPKGDPNTDDYAQAMSAFLPSIEELLLQQWPPSRDSLITAFKLLLYMGKRACADLDAGLKMSG